MAVPPRRVGARPRRRVRRVRLVESRWTVASPCGGEVATRRGFAGRGAAGDSPADEPVCGPAVRERRPRAGGWPAHDWRRARPGLDQRPGGRHRDQVRHRRRADSRLEPVKGTSRAEARTRRGQRLDDRDQRPSRFLPRSAVVSGLGGRAGAAQVDVARWPASGPRAGGKRRGATVGFRQRAVRDSRVPAGRFAPSHPLAVERAARRARGEGVRATGSADARHLSRSRAVVGRRGRPDRAHRGVGGMGLPSRRRPGGPVGAWARAVRFASGSLDTTGVVGALPGCPLLQPTNG